jgi:predicted anti-sigma-YlaC factor YlaD
MNTSHPHSHPHDQELTCRDTIDALMDYLDGTMPATQRARMEEHLKICRSCRNFLASYDRTVQLSRRALLADGVPPPGADQPLPPELVEGILKATRDTQ